MKDKIEEKVAGLMLRKSFRRSAKIYSSLCGFSTVLTGITLQIPVFMRGSGMADLSQIVTTSMGVFVILHGLLRIIAEMNDDQGLRKVTTFITAPVCVGLGLFLLGRANVLGLFMFFIASFAVSAYIQNIAEDPEEISDDHEGFATVFRDIGNLYPNRVVRMVATEHKGQKERVW